MAPVSGLLTGSRTGEKYMDGKFLHEYPLPKQVSSFDTYKRSISHILLTIEQKSKASTKKKFSLSCLPQLASPAPLPSCISVTFSSSPARPSSRSLPHPRKKRRESVNSSSSASMNLVQSLGIQPFQVNWEKITSGHQRISLSQLYKLDN